MSMIVHERYPVAKLPDDLRGELDPGAYVTISLSVTEEDQSAASASDPEMTLTEILALARKSPRRSATEIEAELRAQRDEWDERG